MGQKYQRPSSGVTRAGPVVRTVVGLKQSIPAQVSCVGSFGEAAYSGVLLRRGGPKLDPALIVAGILALVLFALVIQGRL